MEKTLATWAGRSYFKYSGSILTGTVIRFGEGFQYATNVSVEHYKNLIDHFSGGRILVGTSRVNPPPGSLGAWLQTNVTRTAIASYIAPILIEEKYAQRVGKHDILILPKSNM